MKISHPHAWRFGPVFGVAAGVVAQHEIGITAWQEFWIVVGGSLVASGVLILLPRTLRWWLWRRPLRVTYLVPRARYNRLHFDGAPADEQFPDSLRVGLGQYKLVFRMNPKRPNVVVKGIQIKFVGEPDLHMPRDDGLTTLDSGGQFDNGMGKVAYRDWDGQLRLRDNIYLFPKHFGKDDWWDIGNLVTTTKAWVGTVRVTIMWRSESGSETGKYERDLRLVVDADSGTDELPFLKQVV